MNSFSTGWGFDESGEPNPKWQQSPSVTALGRCPGVETRRAGAIHPSIPSVGRPADCTQHTVDRSIDTRVNGLELKCLLRGPMRHSPLSRINQTHRHRRRGERRLLVHMTYEPRNVATSGAYRTGKALAIVGRVGGFCDINGFSGCEFCSYNYSACGLYKRRYARNVGDSRRAAYDAQILMRTYLNITVRSYKNDHSFVKASAPAIKHAFPQLARRRNASTLRK